MGGVAFADLSEGEVGVDLGGLQGGVSEHFSDSVEVAAVGEHRSCETVTESVRAFLGGACGCERFFYYLVEGVL